MKGLIIVSFFLLLVWIQKSGLAKIRRHVLRLEERIDVLERCLDKKEKKIIEKPAKEKIVQKKIIQETIVQKKREAITYPAMDTAPYQRRTLWKDLYLHAKIWIKPLWNIGIDKFMQNWTGIIGAILTVAGVSFLGVYSALKCTPFYRFIIIDAFSLSLIITFFVLKNMSRWIQLALWLRSIAGAVFLFACVGASSIPGLQWIENPLYGFELLLAGIVVNMFLGYIGGKQIFASLHLLLSLLALSIAPQTMVIMLVASIVAFFSVTLTYRERWNYHLLLTISLYFVYNLYWDFSVAKTNITVLQHILALYSITSVSIVALLVHYQKIYSQTKMKALPLVAHLANWFYFAIEILMHAHVIPWKAAILGVAAIAAYLLSRRAKRLNIRWLYLMDALVAQLTGLIAIWTLGQVGIHQYPIAGIMLVEILLFCLIVKLEKEKILYQIGVSLLNILALLMIAYGLFKVTLSHEVAQVMLLCATSGIGFIIYMQKKYNANVDQVLGIILKNEENTRFNGSLFECLAGLMLLAVYKNIYNYSWPSYSIAGLAIIFLFIRQWLQSNGLGIGLVIFLLASHVINWFYLGQSGDMTPINKFICSLPLFILSLSSLMMCYVDCLQNSCRWLGKTLFFIHLTVITYLIFQPLYPLSYVIGAIFIEILIYLTIIQPQKEYLFHNAGMLVANVTFMVMAAVGLINLDFNNSTTLYQNAGACTICAVAILGLYFYFRRCYSEILQKKHFLLISLLLGVNLLLVVADICCYRMLWSGYYLLAVMLPIMFIRWKYQIDGLGEGIYGLLVAAYGLAWLHLFDSVKMTTINQIIYSLPFLAVSLAHIQWSYIKNIEKHMKWFGIYLFFGHIMITVYVVTKSISPFIAGVIWLGLSVVVLEVANLLRNQSGSTIAKKGETDRFLLQIGYILIGAFLIRHVMVHLQSEAYLIFGMRIRFLIEFLAVLIFGYWWQQKPPQEEPLYKSWRILHPLFLELILISIVFTIVVELDSRWHSLSLVVMAILMLPLRNILQGKYSRIGFYSLLLNWAAAINVTFIAVHYVIPSFYWYDQVWMASCVAIVFQFVYIGVIHNRNILKDIQFPVGLQKLQKWSQVVQLRQNICVYYPLFACVAIFLYWSFDKSTLTMLWVLESFGVFILSVILRENNFRYLSMVGLIGCLIRLIVYDLAKSQILIKAIVFLSVGIIMIVMNTIYTKYKERFDE